MKKEFKELVLTALYAYIIVSTIVLVVWAGVSIFRTFGFFGSIGLAVTIAFLLNVLIKVINKKGDKKKDEVKEE